MEREPSEPTCVFIVIHEFKKFERREVDMLPQGPTAFEIGSGGVERPSRFHSSPPIW